MTRSYLVRVPHEPTPTFPDRCISCCEREPDHTRRFVAREFHFSHVLFLYFLGRRTEIDVPICELCTESYLSLLRRWRDRFTVLALAAAVVGLPPIWGLLDGPWKTVSIPFALLAVLVPQLLWKGFAPFPVDPIQVSNGLEFDFREERFASEFAELNGAEVRRR